MESSLFVRQSFFWFRFFMAMLGLLLIVASNLLTPPRTGQLAAMILLAGFAALLWNFPFDLLGDKATLVAAITVAMGLIFGPAQVSIAATGGILIGLTIGRAYPGEQAKPGIVQDVLAALFQIGVIISALSLAWLVYAWLLTSGQGIGLASSAALLVYALIHGVLLSFDGLLRRA